MTSETDVVGLVERALDQTAAIIAAIPDSQGWFGRDPEWKRQG